MLNEPSGATVGPSRASSPAIRSLVLVLPAEPVQRVGDQHGRDPGVARGEHRGGPGGVRDGGVVVPVDVLAGQGHEQSARLDLP